MTGQSDAAAERSAHTEERTYTTGLPAGVRDYGDTAEAAGVARLRERLRAVEEALQAAAADLEFAASEFLRARRMRQHHTMIAAAAEARAALRAARGDEA